MAPRRKAVGKPPGFPATYPSACPDPVRCNLKFVHLGFPAMAKRHEKCRSHGSGGGGNFRQATGKNLCRALPAGRNSTVRTTMLSGIQKDEVERLSRGLPTGSRRGSRAIGHRLTQKERILFEAAKRQGFLKLPVSGLRDNVLNIYRLWCEAEGCPCVVKGGPPA